MARTDLLAVSSETLDSDGVTVRVYQDGRLLATVGSLPREPAFAPQVTLLRAGERELRTAVILPRDGYRPAGPLPVLMAPYGGPSQQVLKARRLFNEPQWLADQGFAVVVADGRGSPGRGPALGARVLSRRGHAGARRPGGGAGAASWPVIRGNSTPAGSASAAGRSAGTCLPWRCCAGPTCSAAAVAGAPVSDWRYYDTAATERWLGHPDEHPDAYERTSLLPLAAGLRRPLLLIHGLADDNVHPRHTLLLSAELLAAVARAQHCSCCPG